MNFMKQYVIVSFSGGKDSTAMLLRMFEIGEHIDEVIFCDTGKEFPSMYKHIENVKRFVEDNGIKFTILKSEKSFDYYMFEHNPKRRNLQFLEKKGFSWATFRVRWCTSILKTDVIKSYLKQLNKKYDVIQSVGIAFDEQYRLSRKNNKKQNHRHPLVEWGWTEQQCLQYCYDNGFNWDGLYEKFSRVSCWCCPLQSLSDLRVLWRDFPELWEELKDMDRRTYLQFTIGYSVEELDKRFAFEQERQKQGLSITNRGFYKELKILLKKDVLNEQESEE